MFLACQFTKVRASQDLKERSQQWRLGKDNYQFALCVESLESRRPLKIQSGQAYVNTVILTRFAVALCDVREEEDAGNSYPKECSTRANNRMEGKIYVKTVPPRLRDQNVINEQSRKGCIESGFRNSSRRETEGK